MLLSEQVCRVPDILRVSKLMAMRNKQSYAKAVALLQDKERKLVAWFIQIAPRNPFLQLGVERSAA